MNGSIRGKSRMLLLTLPRANQSNTIGREVVDFDNAVERSWTQLLTLPGNEPAMRSLGCLKRRWMTNN